MMRKLSVALIQLKVCKDKTINISRAAEKIKLATEGRQTNIVALPECFNSPYGVQYFRDNAELIPSGPTSKMLSDAAKQNVVYVVGGTIPELDDGQLYNTCTVWNPSGELIAKYRKMHLFDINIPGKISFQESEVLKPGNELITFTVNDIKVGLGICYDLRFEELAKLYRKSGCDLLMYPGSFNMTTGPLHWELLQRARAVDNQVFVCSISPARNEKGYISWGHTQITSPWGAVKNLEAEEDILFDTLDFKECEEVRENIPVFKQRRTDIYDTTQK